jgi:hypothetical protein
MRSYIRVGCDDLLLRGEVGALLELKVSNGSRKSKIPIDSTKINEPTSGAYSRLFAWSPN